MLVIAAYASVGRWRILRLIRASSVFAEAERFVVITTVIAWLIVCSALFIIRSQIFRKNEETRLDAFEMKGLRKILRVSWTAKKTNEWVLNKAGVKSELLDTVKARKLAYTMVTQW